METIGDSFVTKANKQQTNKKKGIQNDTLLPDPGTQQSTSAYSSVYQKNESSPFTLVQWVKFFLKKNLNYMINNLEKDSKE